jgi:hypothetical protein
MRELLLATYGRVVVVVCGLIAVFVAGAYVAIKGDRLEPLGLKPLSRTEKIMVWASISMAALTLLAGLVRR